MYRPPPPGLKAGETAWITGTILKPEQPFWVDISFSFSQWFWIPQVKLGSSKHCGPGLWGRGLSFPTCRAAPDVETLSEQLEAEGATKAGPFLNVLSSLSIRNTEQDSKQSWSGFHYSKMSKWEDKERLSSQWWSKKNLTNNVKGTEGKARER